MDTRSAGRPLSASRAAGKWTISDVARLAGVSVKTVSRVLNNEPAVHDETRRHVLRIIDDLGSQPHSGARSLRGRPPNCVGVSLGAPASAAPLSQDIMMWVFSQLYTRFGVDGTYICFDLNPGADRRGGDYARGLWERLYHGIVITGPLPLDDTVLRRIHNSGKPYLLIGRLDTLPEASSAIPDIEEGAYLATRHLIERGHRRIGLLTAFEGLQAGEDRKAGYRRALEEAELPLDPQIIEPVSFQPSSVVHGVHRLLSDRRVTALVDSSGTEDGASLREGFARAGRTVGANLEVVTWSYTREAAVLAEATAQVWVPLRECMLAGLKQFADWFNGHREGPVQVRYRPILERPPLDAPLCRPRIIFGSLDA